MTIVRPEILPDKFDRTSTTLELPDGLDFDQWADLGRPLLAAAETVQWWLGDWLRYGERCYGAQYRSAAEWTQLEPGTLANIQSVAEAVPPERRRLSLSWTHHRAVAALTGDDQDRLLDQAEQRGLSTRDLEAEVRRCRTGEPPSPARPTGPVPPATITRTLVAQVPAGDAEHLSAVLTAMADQLRVELPVATVDVR